MASHAPQSFAQIVAEYYQTELAARFSSPTSPTHPIIFPAACIGPILLPILYLSIPHYRFSRTGFQRTPAHAARWPVLALALALDFDIVRTTSSANLAFAYLAGLLAAWGAITACALLVCSDPQLDAARVMRDPAGNAVWQPFPHAARWHTRFAWALDLFLNFRGVGWNVGVAAIPQAPPPPRGFPRTYLCGGGGGGGGGTHSNGVAHHGAAKRTQPHDPAFPPGLPPADIAAVPLRTRAGFVRQPSAAAFVATALRTWLGCWLALDALLVLVMRPDPYFVLGPTLLAAPLPHPLAAQLAHLPDYAHTSALGRYAPHVALAAHPRLLHVVRDGEFLALAVISLTLVLTFYDLVVQFALVGHVLRAHPTRREAWQYASTYGAWANVAERGLAGWWGGWWHQTFRFAFTAPARVAVDWWWGGSAEHGREEQGDAEQAVRRAARKRQAYIYGAAVSSFALSALLHCCGSATTATPRTRGARPALFFALQGVGTVGQQAVGAAIQAWCRTEHEDADERTTLKTRLQHVLAHRRTRRAANVLGALGWLHASAWVFCDDFVDSGVGLYEPVTVSPARAAGLGAAGEGVWRWDATFVPRWHAGPTWWQTGVAV